MEPVTFPRKTSSNNASEKKKKKIGKSFWNF